MKIKFDKGTIQIQGNIRVLDLVDQWRTRIKKEFKTEVGMLGGGEWDIKALTVSTYDSAYIHADKLGNRFGLIILVACHIFLKFPAPISRSIYSSSTDKYFLRSAIPC